MQVAPPLVVGVTASLGDRAFLGPVPFGPEPWAAVEGEGASSKPCLSLWPPYNRQYLWGGTPHPLAIMTSSFATATLLPSLPFFPNRGYSHCHFMVTVSSMVVVGEEGKLGSSFGWGGHLSDVCTGSLGPHPSARLVSMEIGH